MNTAITQQIDAELDRIERQEHVRILYACESGSRAWGFASNDSDYDVRFIYLRPTEWYLTIRNPSDVIEPPIDGDLDLAGWDLPKALELFRKSNPPLLEWLQSPIVYRDHSGLAERLRALMPDYYSPISCMYHYLHMAQGNYREYLQGDQVWLKKYFYVLRPVLACLWIERGLGVAPTEFAALLDRLIDEAPLKRAIRRLLDDKTAGRELDQGPAIPEIAQFLDAQLARLSAENQPPPATRDPAPLDRVFVETLIEVNGDRIGISGDD
ncbi:MAG: nucleotidyltransferase domain-containing protein [Phycisphaerae bacterium]|nr:nucleotidyltransferase domain-containing protein [Phycisphaerae bacterium]